MRVGLLLTLCTFAAAACSADNDAGSLLVDPAHYTVYRCDDLAARWKVLVARQKELSGLMEKAGEGGGGGAVVGSLAYRTDYDEVIGEEKLLQKTAAEKNCDFKPQFQSDQIIR